VLRALLIQTMRVAECKELALIAIAPGAEKPPFLCFGKDPVCESGSRP